MKIEPKLVATHGWCGIAANSASGRGKGQERVERLVRELTAMGVESRVAWSLDERKALVSDAGKDVSCLGIVAVGGDGTVAGLLNEQPTVPVTVMPAGTENLFARHFGVRADPKQVARTVKNGRTIATDLGVAQGRRFSLMAGFGFDAEVVSRHHRVRASSGVPRPTNRVAYVEPVLRSSFTYRFTPLTIDILDEGQEETLVGTTAFIFNLPRYALGLPFAPTATGHDGLVDLVVFRNPGPFQALRYLWLVFRGIHLNEPGVYHRKIRRARVATQSPVPVQLDGDPGGVVTIDSPWDIQVLPNAISILVPDVYQMGLRPVRVASGDAIG